MPWMRSPRRRRWLAISTVVTLVAVPANAEYLVEGTATDVDAFVAMRTACREASADFKRECDVICASAERLRIFVSRDQARTLVDSFQSRSVDVGDLERVPATAPAGSPNATTRCQVLKHIIAEYWHAQSNAGAEFGPAHTEGIDGENKVRTDLGQTGKVTGRRTKKVGDNWTIETTFDNGDTETWTLDASTNISSITYNQAGQP